MKSVMLVLSILFMGVLSGLLQDNNKDALIWYKGFPCGSAGKESACHVGDLGSISGLESSPGEGKGYPPQYSDLENSMEYSPWRRKQSNMTNFHFQYDTMRNYQVFIKAIKTIWNMNLQ